ncbi:MAG: AraC family transcriptional regulator [Porticoccaceae bacterium]|nr:helix-turn-helix transcriptional regulator [Pseudomonadales bacterium]MCP5171789.1 helix-turn-helix transcriptional regulator [Pseudomonadales bacterium]
MSHFTLSSNGTALNARTELLQETYSNIAQRTVNTVGDNPLTFSFNGRMLEDVTVMRSSSSPVYARRSESQASDGNDNWILHLITDGKAMIQQKGADESICGAGTLYVEPADSPGVFLLDNITFYDISIPRGLIAPRVGSENRFLRKANNVNESPVAKHFLDYARLFTHDTGILSPEMSALAKNHMVDLAVLLLCGAEESVGATQNQGLKAARLQAIRQDIMSHLCDSDLAIGAVSARVGISPQYVRALFNAEGTTFADFVGNSRLDLVCRQLKNPLYKHYSISQLAYDAGFNNLSWFNKAFKQRFDLTPTEVRRES